MIGRTGTCYRPDLPTQCSRSAGDPYTITESESPHQQPSYGKYGRKTMFSGSASMLCTSHWAAHASAYTFQILAKNCLILFAKT